MRASRRKLLCETQNAYFDSMEIEGTGGGLVMSLRFDAHNFEDYRTNKENAEKFANQAKHKFFDVLASKAKCSIRTDSVHGQEAHDMIDELGKLLDAGSFVWYIEKGSIIVRFVVEAALAMVAGLLAAIVVAAAGVIGVAVVVGVGATPFAAFIAGLLGGVLGYVAVGVGIFVFAVDLLRRIEEWVREWYNERRNRREREQQHSRDIMNVREETRRRVERQQERTVRSLRQINHRPVPPVPEPSTEDADVVGTDAPQEQHNPQDDSDAAIVRLSPSSIDNRTILERLADIQDQQQGDAAEIRGRVRNTLQQMRRLACDASDSVVEENMQQAPAASNMRDLLPQQQKLVKHFCNLEYFGLMLYNDAEEFVRPSRGCQFTDRTVREWKDLANELYLIAMDNEADNHKRILDAKRNLARYRTSRFYPTFSEAAKKAPQFAFIVVQSNLAMNALDFIASQWQSTSNGGNAFLGAAVTGAAVTALAILRSRRTILLNF